MYVVALELLDNNDDYAVQDKRAVFMLQRVAALDIHENLIVITSIGGDLACILLFGYAFY
jgi:hypothetical protein